MISRGAGFRKSVPQTGQTLALPMEPQQLPQVNRSFRPPHHQSKSSGRTDILHLRSQNWRPVSNSRLAAMAPKEMAHRYLSPVDIAQSVCQLVGLRPAHPNEYIQNLHECDVAFRTSAQEWPELGQISLDRLHNQVFGKRVVLIIVDSTGFDGLCDEQKDASGVQWDEKSQCFVYSVRGVRMRHGRESFQ